MTVSDSLVFTIVPDRTKKIANRSESETVYYTGRDFGSSPIPRPWGTHHDSSEHPADTGRERKDLRCRYLVFNQNMRVVGIFAGDVGSTLTVQRIGRCSVRRREPRKVEFHSSLAKPPIPSECRPGRSTNP